MIIFDLEWNHGYKPRLPDEILQIGAVKVDQLGGRIIDTFNAYIHPSVYKKLYHKAKELPDKDLYFASPLDFPSAYRENRFSVKFHNFNIPSHFIFVRPPVPYTNSSYDGRHGTKYPSYSTEILNNIVEIPPASEGILCQILQNPQIIIAESMPKPKRPFQITGVNFILFSHKTTFLIPHFHFIKI